MHLFLPDQLDFVGRVEQLSAGFARLRKEIGIAEPRGKVNKTKHKPYQEYYTPETKDAVYRKYRQDFKLFGYEF